MKQTCNPLHPSINEKKSVFSLFHYSLFIVHCSLFIALLLTGCKKEANELDTKSAEYERINKFIIDGVHEVYLWEAETDWNQFETREAYALYTDHYQLFEKLIYQDDYWSTLTNDIEGLGSQFDGISTTFGYTLRFYRLPSDDIIAVVLYASPHSPAENAGLKRGDVIIKMNGANITLDNYMNLYYAPSISIRCGELEGSTFIELPETISLTAVEMYENPIVTHRTIDMEGQKIGYLCYTGYQRDSEDELIQLFSEFKSDGVNEVVLDLRYNPGGYSRTALILSSILAPEQVVKRKDTYLVHHYNALLTSYYNQRNESLNENFVDTLPVNMNLSRLYVLTGNNTASASEATMVGLEPYLDLVQIGETTSGKYCGGTLLSPSNIYLEKDRDYFGSFSNWGMYLMIYRFANIKGITSFTGGLVPNIEAEEDDFDLKPFGDEDDPLLGRALAHIKGVEYIEKRASRITVPLTPLPVLKKPFDGMMIEDNAKWIMQNAKLRMEE